MGIFKTFAQEVNEVNKVASERKENWVGADRKVVVVV